MRHVVHLVGLYHTLLKEDKSSWCAFTMKNYRLPAMLKQGGIDCIVYGPDEVDEHVTTQCLEYVPVVTKEHRLKYFGSPEWDNTKMFDRWDIQDPMWIESNHRVAEEIRKRWEPGDYIGHFGGRCQEQIGQELTDLNPQVIELGIGYEGVCPDTYHIYESYTWMHYLSGMWQFLRDVRFYDTVIPNCYSLDEFTPRYDVNTKDGFLLWLARPISRKGISVLSEIAKHTDIPIKIAGQPGIVDIKGAEYVGVVHGKEKKELLSNALALISPSLYCEPFNGVSVESQMSGTPVICTDFGAMTETVIQGITGFRCHNLQEFLKAIEKAPSLNRRTIAYHASTNYSTDQGATLYKQYFDKLNTLFQDGWYQL